MNNKKKQNKATLFIVVITSLIIYVLLMILCINKLVISYNPLSLTLMSISFGFYMIGFLIMATPKRFYNLIYKLFHKSLEEGYYQITMATYENNKFYIQSERVLLNLSYIILIIILLIG